MTPNLSLHRQHEQRCDSNETSESHTVVDLDPTDTPRLEPKCRGLAMWPDGSICKLGGWAQVRRGGEQDCYSAVICVAEGRQMVTGEKRVHADCSVVRCGAE